MQDSYGYDTAATSGSSTGGSVLYLVIMLATLALLLFVLASMWRVFSKAGKRGWAAFVPVYNSLVMLQIIGRPWWWLLLMFVPLVNVVIAIIVALDLAKVYGKGTLFAILGLILTPIGYFIIAFGKATYTSPNSGDTTTPTPPAPMPTPQIPAS